jgi:hypothetical protein
MPVATVISANEGARRVVAGPDRKGLTTVRIWPGQMVTSARRTAGHIRRSLA